MTDYLAPVTVTTFVVWDLNEEHPSAEHRGKPRPIGTEPTLDAAIEKAARLIEIKAAKGRDTHVFLTRRVVEHKAESPDLDPDEPVVPSTGVRVERTADGWEITALAELTDAQAAAITFRADPALVRPGQFVAVEDAGGTRIGHVSGVTYHESGFAPAYALVSITLR